RPLADGWQAWVVSDVERISCHGAGGSTKNRDRDSIVGEVHAPDFMVEAGRELAIGAGNDAAAATLVRLAVPTIGAQAAVLLPAPRARMAWWRCADSGVPPTQGMTRSPAMRTAPILAGALRGTTGTVTVPADELPALAAVFGSAASDELPVV